MFPSSSSRSRTRSHRPTSRRTAHGATRRKSDYQSSSYTSTPSAVLIRNDEEAYFSSSSDSDEDNNYRYGGSTSPSKGNDRKKKTRRRRSFLEEMRLWFLTGRLPRPRVLLVVGMVILLVGWLLTTSIGASDSSSIRQSVLKQDIQFDAKPAMVGMFFHGVSSQSFSGVVHPIDVPHNHQEWLELLEKRLHHSSFHQYYQYSHNTNNNNNNQHHSTERHNHHHHHHHHDVNIVPVKPLSTHLDSIAEGSESYEDEKPSYSPDPDNCQPQYEWQTQTYPTCNTLHEVTMMRDRMYLQSTATLIDMEVPPSPNSDYQLFLRDQGMLRRHLPGQGPRRRQQRRRRTIPTIVQRDNDNNKDKDENALPEQFEMLGNGYWRNTWVMQTPLTTQDASSSPTRYSSYDLPVERLAFKTMKYEHDVTEYLVDKQRRDSVTSDRLQFSSHAIDMYAYCGTSAVYEYAPGGDLESLIQEFGSAQEFLKFYPLPERYTLAYNVTVSLADVHSSEGSHRPPAIIHADFKTDQFVAVTPVDWKSLQPENRYKKGVSHRMPHFKLGDFNLARFPYWNAKQQHVCEVDTDGNGGELRAPEEYADDGPGLTAKLDVYSLGNVLYTLLTGYFPFDELEDSPETKVMKRMVEHGRRPKINLDVDYTHSQDPMIRALVTAIKWCWEQNPHHRPSAQQVEDLLGNHLPRGVERIPRRR